MRRVTALRLSCPRCRLAITPRTTWLIPAHCPRCIARAHVAVALCASPPADERHGADAPVARERAVELDTGLRP